VSDAAAASQCLFIRGTFRPLSGRRRAGLCPAAEQGRARAAADHGRVLCFRNYEQIVKAHQDNPNEGKDQVSDEVKFNVFQGIMESLFQSFNASISVTSFQELSACVFSWIEEHCKPQVSAGAAVGRARCIPGSPVPSPGTSKGAARDGGGGVGGTGDGARTPASPAPAVGLVWCCSRAGAKGSSGGPCLAPSLPRDTGRFPGGLRSRGGGEALSQGRVVPRCGPTGGRDPCWGGGFGAAAVPEGCPGRAARPSVSPLRPRRCVTLSSGSCASWRASASEPPPAPRLRGCRPPTPGAGHGGCAGCPWLLPKLLWFIYCIEHRTSARPGRALRAGRCHQVFVGTQQGGDDKKVCGEQGVACAPTRRCSAPSGLRHGPCRSRGRGGTRTRAKSFGFSWTDRESASPLGGGFLGGGWVTLCARIAAEQPQGEPSAAGEPPSPAQPPLPRHRARGDLLRPGLSRRSRGSPDGETGASFLRQLRPRAAMRRAASGCGSGRGRTEEERSSAARRWLRLLGYAHTWPALIGFDFCFINPWTQPEALPGQLCRCSQDAFFNPSRAAAMGRGRGSANTNAAQLLPTLRPLTVRGAGAAPARCRRGRMRALWSRSRSRSRAAGIRFRPFFPCRCGGTRLQVAWFERCRTRRFKLLLLAFSSGKTPLEGGFYTFSFQPCLWVSFSMQWKPRSQTRRRCSSPHRVSGLVPAWKVPLCEGENPCTGVRALQPRRAQAAAGSTTGSYRAHRWQRCIFLSWKVIK